MQNNHKIMQDYCKQFLNSDFRKNMEFLLDRTPIEIDSITRYNENFQKQLERVVQKDLIIECKTNDVNLLI